MDYRQNETCKSDICIPNVHHSSVLHTVVVLQHMVTVTGRSKINHSPLWQIHISGLSLVARVTHLTAALQEYLGDRDQKQHF